MPLTTGEKLGPYKILSAIGAGGMGEVYKARDTRLDRTVAIKVLPEHIAKREDLRARFEREARAVASLNHPNICVLYDIGNQDGAGYMVMEFMEGETLASRIEKGALPLDHARKFAIQIADAFDRAHRAGVTHRDIKPQNIMLTRDGAKVLDFGLAKSNAKVAPTEATLTAALTTEGTVMGTPQYMAPEQFEGKEADARSDIWAFGAVLYEMVTGQKAFQGKTYSSLVGAILSADPPPMSVKPFTPAWLERLVRRCLQKDPEDRYQSMRDVVLDLRAPAPEIAAPAKPSRWPWAAVAVAALAAGWLLKPSPNAPELPVRSFSFAPESLGKSDIARKAVLSPDGRHIAYIAADHLWIRDLDNEQPRRLEGTNGADGPFWSPDSAFVGFAAGQELKKISVHTGAAFSLGRLSGAYRSGAWSPDGRTILISPLGKGLWEAPAEGGTLRRVLPTKAAGTYYSMVFLPLADGRRFVVAGVGTRSRRNLELMNVATGERQVLREGAEPSWSATGHILYQASADQPGLWALPFSLQTMKPSGETFPVLRTGSDFSSSFDGTLVWVDSTVAERRLAWRDREGKLLGVAGQPQQLMRNLALSPDGARLALTAEEQGNIDIWIHDLKTSVKTRFTFDPALDAAARWSPSGTQIAFVSYRSGGGDIFVQSADGSGEAKLLVSTDVHESPTSWSGDGTILMFTRMEPKTGSDLWFMKRKPDGAFGEPVPLLRTQFDEWDGQIAPNGRYFLYVSDETGRNEIFVRSFPEGGKWQISSQGGEHPRWSRDGKEIFYVEGRNTLVSVPVTATDSFTAGPAKRLFSNRGLTSPTGYIMYDAAPDSKRFIIAEPADAETKPPAIHVIQNWQALLRQRAEQ